MLRVLRHLLVFPTLFCLDRREQPACQHGHPSCHGVVLCHGAPWVETEGHEVFEELGFEEYGLVSVDVMRVEPRVDDLGYVGAVRVDTFSFC